VNHHPPSRLEGFSDAVFGFALTLLVVQLEAPSNHQELEQLVRGFFPFAVTFAMVCYIWWEHNKFFRHYGLQDAWTAFLNAVLLFVVLFYVYPLKFLAVTLLGPVVGLPGPGGFADGRFVMLVYSGGVALIFGVFRLLYRHAAKQRHLLGLDPADELRLHFGARAQSISLGLALLSLALAVLLPERWIWLTGMIYALMGPLHAWNGIAGARAQRSLTGES
jgi:hypothetical protein